MTHHFGIGCAHPRREYVQNQDGVIIAWACPQCHARGTSGLPKPMLKGCEWCGADYLPIPGNWFLKRYCSRRCYWDDLDERRIEGRPLTNPDPLQRGRHLEYET
jgi:hypothetical protein